LKLLEGAWCSRLLFRVCHGIMIWDLAPGCGILIDKTRPPEEFRSGLIKSLEKRPPNRSKGTAVFLPSDPNFVPTALCIISAQQGWAPRTQCDPDD